MSDRSTEDALKGLSAQVGVLVRKELRSALREKATRLGLAGGLISLAGVLAFYAGALIIAGMVLWLSRWLPPWLASIVTGLALGGIAVLSAVCGQRKLRATGLVPEKTLATAESDLQAAAEREPNE